MFFLSIGCFAYWCCPCFMCKLHARTNECLCTGCLPGCKFIEFKHLQKSNPLTFFLANTGLRTKIRTGFRIRV